MKGKTVALICILILSATYANAQTRIDLSGRWQCELGTINFPATIDETRISPRNQDKTYTGGLTRNNPYKGVLEYNTTVSIPHSFDGKDIIMYLERTRPSKLYIDDDSIGCCDYLEAPHVYNLTGKLSYGTHLLRIIVDNRDTAVPKEVLGSHMWAESTQTNWNGILGKMYLEAKPPVYVTDMKITPINEYSYGALLEFNINADKDYKNLTIGLDSYTEIGLKQKGISTSSKNYNWKTIADDKTINNLLITTGNDMDRQSNADNTVTLIYSRLNSNGSTTIVTEKNILLKNAKIETALKKGVNKFFIKVSSISFKSWSEFHPYMQCWNLKFYTLNKQVPDSNYPISFGIRMINRDGYHLMVNGFPVFLRGTHDGCVWPITGYAPMNTDDWGFYFAKLKMYGFNHVRCHSWTVPEAAFEAADRLGIYLQVELPYWGVFTPTNKKCNEFMMNEAKAILKAYGNHPSFFSLSMGNELSGDQASMTEFCNQFRALDPRHLYITGSNNFLGRKGPADADDYFVTCRNGDGPGYTTDTRLSFANIDEPEGGLINTSYPNTMHNYSDAVKDVTVPVVSHEIGQYQSYPSFEEIEKYDGVLHPYNLEIFKKRLTANGMEDYAEQFALSSGNWAFNCYKADIETCLRTPQISGFQMLDVKDYPGQGTALVGILDAFLAQKASVVRPKIFREFNSALTAMAEFPKRCYLAGENFCANACVANYTEADAAGAFSWKLNREDGTTVLNGNFNLKARKGEITASECPILKGQVPESHNRTVVSTSKGIVFEIPSDLETGRYILRINYAATTTNHYEIWIYQNDDAKIDVIDKFKKAESSFDLNETTHVSYNLKDAINNANNGKNVLFLPQHSEVDSVSYNGMFMPDFWNYSMFKKASEDAKKEVSPGYLSICTKRSHPIFNLFPTTNWTSWQWFCIQKNSRPMILDSLKEVEPIVMVVDNVERNHKLGIIYEAQVGKGNILVCTTDFKKITEYPEGRAYISSIVNYIESDDFAPHSMLTTNQLYEVFKQKAPVQPRKPRTAARGSRR